MGKNEEQRPHHADIPQQGDEEKKNSQRTSGGERGRNGRAESSRRTERFKESVCVYVMALEDQRPALRAAVTPDSEEEG